MTKKLIHHLCPIVLNSNEISYKLTHNLHHLFISCIEIYNQGHYMKVYEANKKWTQGFKATILTRNELISNFWFARASLYFEPEFDTMYTTFHSANYDLETEKSKPQFIIQKCVYSYALLSLVNLQQFITNHTSPSMNTWEEKPRKAPTWCLRGPA